jgi:2-methylcitrate dehydratase PrpD
VALRRKVVAVVDEGIAEESAGVTALLVDGRREHVFVEHAIGSLQRPMSDTELEAKFARLVSPVLGTAGVAPLVQACQGLAACGDVRALTALARAA